MSGGESEIEREREERRKRGDRGKDREGQERVSELERGKRETETYLEFVLIQICNKRMQHRFTAIDTEHTSSQGQLFRYRTTTSQFSSLR